MPQNITQVFNNIDIIKIELGIYYTIIKIFNIFSIYEQ